ncbi:VOC family protein [Stenotrophomonas chelatiphaga]|uniref:VOC family protein n=1 Tax=Stenotrophomonas chelatiphaga TaxID=517011 RepID=UPI0028A212E6|nr:VOC family protein [Stenotrophomonas chelatiphaga]
MFKPDAVMHYVRDVPLSAAFYAGIMGRPASQLAPGFALFVVPGGPALGLWQREEVQPTALGAPGACELTMVVASAADVVRMHAAWLALGVEIAQAPATLAFGHTFVGLDPDGHRLRVHSRAEGLPPREA